MVVIMIYMVYRFTLYYNCPMRSLRSTDNWDLQVIFWSYIWIFELISGKFCMLRRYSFFCLLWCFFIFSMFLKLSVDIAFFFAFLFFFCFSMSEESINFLFGYRLYLRTYRLNAKTYLHCFYWGKWENSKQKEKDWFISAVMHKIQLLSNECWH